MMSASMRPLPIATAASGLATFIASTRSTILPQRETPRQERQDSIALQEARSVAPGKSVYRVANIRSYTMELKLASTEYSSRDWHRVSIMVKDSKKYGSRAAADSAMWSMASRSTRRRTSCFAYHEANVKEHDLVFTLGSVIGRSVGDDEVLPVLITKADLSAVKLKRRALSQ
jgi:hypothetical protein